MSHHHHHTHHFVTHQIDMSLFASPRLLPFSSLLLHSTSYTAILQSEKSEKQTSNRTMMLMKYSFLFALYASHATAFTPKTREAARRDVPVVTTNSALKAAAPGTVERTARQKGLLSRKGPFFKLDRSEGAVEFGSSAVLTTKLTDPSTHNLEGISEWLSDGRGLALSIFRNNKGIVFFP